MQLPAGATGFGFRSAPEASPFTEFQAVCHVVARAARVRRVQACAAYADGSCANFHWAEFDKGSHHVWALLNAHAPLLAFADALPRFGQISFVDDPPLAEAFAVAGGLTALSAAQLTADLSAGACTLLHRVERDQIRHWQPATVGEVVFNHWG
jgi:hypothetical protein